MFRRMFRRNGTPMQSARASVTLRGDEIYSFHDFPPTEAMVGMLDCVKELCYIYIGDHWSRSIFTAKVSIHLLVIA